MKWATVLMVISLSGCALTHVDKTDDPKDCRERAAYHIISNYPDPNNLRLALDTICEGQMGPTTTRLP